MQSATTATADPNNKNVLRTENFVFVFAEVVSDDGMSMISSSSGRMLSPVPTITKDAPLLFSFKIFSRLDLRRSRSVFATTEAGTPFVRAAVGDDSLTPGNGEYRIVQNNQLTTTHQTVDSVRMIQAGEVWEGRPPAKWDQVVIQG